jgi:hypothetical protein
VNLTNTAFYSCLPLLYAQVPPANISAIELDWQPIGRFGKRLLPQQVEAR